MNSLISSLRAFRNDAKYQQSDFANLYQKLLLENNPHNWNDEDRIRILKWAIIFFNQDYVDAQKLGYRILLRYANLFNSYTPLYDAALNFGYMPVVKFIESKLLKRGRKEHSFHAAYISSYLDLFKNNEAYFSYGQSELFKFMSDVNSDSLIVAPTSYGKSEMIVQRVEANKNKRICILVPSKALLAQTKRRLLEREEIAKNYKRIITHAEMYRPGEDEFVAVLTQERLLRILQKNEKFGLDMLLVDEAHNVLHADQRAELLMQVIMITKKRNPVMALHFFTPFMVDPINVQTRFSDYQVSSKKNQEFIKVERYHYYDPSIGELSLYDQFLDSFIKMSSQSEDTYSFIKKFSANKNIIYANTPRQAEEAAHKISKHCPTIDLSLKENFKLREACSAIEGYLHKEYSLIDRIKHGVVYHHGKVPEIIRLYVEKIFSEHPLFKFISTTSTLLEGVNIPAEKIFLISPNKGRGHLKKAEFRNLTGRICRFSEIFSYHNTSLEMLEPHIYIVKSIYYDSDFSASGFFSKVAKIATIEKDDVENILLKKTETDSDREKERASLEHMENVEKGILSPDRAAEYEIRYAASDIAKACFRNNVHEFDIFEAEKELNDNLNKNRLTNKISDEQVLIKTISDVFIKIIAKDDSGYDDKKYALARLQNEKAQNFYAKFLKWRADGASYSEMIGHYLSYWHMVSESADFITYVGRAWGEIKLHPDDREERHVNMKEKTLAQRVNLAVVKIHEEKDFIENTILKFVEVLHDLELLEEAFYDHIKYGSSDPEIIALLKSGFSIELTKLLMTDTYKKFVSVDLATDTIRIKSDVKHLMHEHQENRILIFELEFHLLDD